MQARKKISTMYRGGPNAKLSSVLAEAVGELTRSVVCADDVPVDLVVDVNDDSVVVEVVEKVWPSFDARTGLSYKPSLSNCWTLG